MTKKRLLLLAIALVACVFLAQGALMMLAANRPGVTKANFDRIQDGMTFEQVKEIFADEPSYLEGRLMWYAAVWQQPSGGRAEVAFSRDKVGLGFKVSHKEWTNPAMVALEDLVSSNHR